MSQEKPVPTETRLPPQDKLKIVGIIFFMLGLGNLLPWNFFITAIPYFEKRLNETTPESEMGSEPRAWHFGNWLTFLSMFPLLLFSCLNSVLYPRIPERLRIAGTLILIFSLFLVTVIVVKLKLSPAVFFGITMAIVWFINSSSAVLQGSLFGLLGLLPPGYSSLFMSGQGVAGIFAAIASIITQASKLDEETAALGYFITPCLFILITIFLYFLLSRLEFAKFYFNKDQPLPGEEQAMMGGGKEIDISMEPTERRNEIIYVIKVFKKIWVMALSVCLIFAVTLSIFPAITASVKSQVTDGEWGDYFIPVGCFLLFNVMDWAGRSVTGYIMWPKMNSRVLPLLVGLRSVFVPLMMLCNVQPRDQLPVVFPGDAWYLCFMALFALSNGYLVTLCVSYAPKKVSPKDAETAGAVMSFFLSLGLASGAALSFLIRVLI